MKCGEEIRLLDNCYNSNVARFIAQCDGRFILISGDCRDYRNGFLLTSWHGVLRELVARTVPATLTEKIVAAESQAGGRYNRFALTYPLSAKGLADLMGVDADDVRAQLEDLAVATDAL